MDTGKWPIYSVTFKLKKKEQNQDVFSLYLLEIILKGLFVNAKHSISFIFIVLGTLQLSLVSTEVMETKSNVKNVTFEI